MDLQRCQWIHIGSLHMCQLVQIGIHKHVNKSTLRSPTMTKVQVWFVDMVGDLNVDYWLVCRSRFWLIDTYGETNCGPIDTFADPSIMNILEVLAFLKVKESSKYFFYLIKKYYFIILYNISKVIVTWLGPFKFKVS